MFPTLGICQKDFSKRLLSPFEAKISWNVRCYNKFRSDWSAFADRLSSLRLHTGSSAWQFWERLPASTALDGLFLVGELEGIADNDRPKSRSKGRVTCWDKLHFAAVSDLTAFAVYLGMSKKTLNRAKATCAIGRLFTWVESPSSLTLHKGETSSTSCICGRHFPLRMNARIPGDNVDNMRPSIWSGICWQGTRESWNVRSEPHHHLLHPGLTKH